MKKVAIIGTHGTGKTTTCLGIGYRLKQMRYDTEVLYECARKCPLPINQKGTIQSQKWILGEQLKQESLIDPNIDFAICDRSIVDIYVYSLMASRKFARSLLPLIVNHMKTFDYIFYLPIRDKYFKGDSKRSSDKQYQVDIDRGMLEIIDFLNVHDIIVIPVKNDNIVADRITSHLVYGRKV